MASRLSMSPSPQERKRGEPLEFGKASLACCPLVSSAYDSVVKWHVSDTGLQEWYTTWTGLEQSQPRALSSPDRRWFMRRAGNGQVLVLSASGRVCVHGHWNRPGASHESVRFYLTRHRSFLCSVVATGLILLGFSNKDWKWMKTVGKISIMFSFLYFSDRWKWKWEEDERSVSQERTKPVGSGLYRKWSVTDN
jgi:hypothetical protein